MIDHSSTSDRRVQRVVVRAHRARRHDGDRVTADGQPAVGSTAASAPPPAPRGPRLFRSVVARQGPGVTPAGERVVRHAPWC
jgi:hypothetical protein